MTMKCYFHDDIQGYHTQLFFKMEQSNISSYKRMATMWITNLSVICTLDLISTTHDV
jgi:hypothetical protein